MSLYIGTKMIRAFAMTRLAYNELRGWELPADEDGADEGYLVEYLDGGKANHPDYAGYISWSPKDVFEKAYKPTTGMDFGMAVSAMKEGHKISRAGWNDKRMFLRYVAKGMYDVACGVVDFSAENPCNPSLLPWIGMKTADNCFVPWLASQTDMLATDWVLVE